MTIFNVRYKVVRGALDLGGVAGRKTSRSKYGGALWSSFVFFQIATWADSIVYYIHTDSENAKVSISSQQCYLFVAQFKHVYGNALLVTSQVLTAENVAYVYGRDKYTLRVMKCAGDWLIHEYARLEQQHAVNY